MRILFHGNHLKHFNLATWLRQRGHDAVVLLTRRSKPSELPEWELPSLCGAYPEWIRDVSDLMDRPRDPAAPSMRIPDRLEPIMREQRIGLPREIRELGRDFDIVVTSGAQNLLEALDHEPPVVLRAIGSDMSRLPFGCTTPEKEFRSYYMRRNVGRLAAIIAYQDDTYWAARFIGALDKLVWYSVPTDVDALVANTNRLLLAELDERYRRHSLVVFSPARAELDPRQSCYKGNENLLEAFRALAAECPRVRLVSIVGGAGFADFRSRVESLGLSDRVEFVAHDHPDAPDYKYLPLPDLTAHMQIRNGVVANDFGFAKWYLTGSAREALSVGAALVDGVDTGCPEFLALYGPGCPLVSARSPDEILARLRALLETPVDHLERLRERGQAWARRHLDQDARIDELVDILEGVVEGRLPAGSGHRVVTPVHGGERARFSQSVSRR